MKNDNTIFTCQNYPVFQNKMYTNELEAISCPKGDIKLVIDEKTGIIHNCEFDEKKVNYDHDYHNEQGLSQTFSRHLNEISKLVINHLGKVNIVEIGCGKGLFLNILSERGVDITGFDPTYQGDDCRIRAEYFTEDTPIKCDGIILRHVLEHIKNPLDFLKSLKESSPKHCKIFIEVPSLEWIIRKNAWYDIFYEHVNYFRKQDFSRLFKKILACDYVFNGQYIYVIANLSDLNVDIEIKDCIQDLKIDIKNTALDKIDQSKKIVIWGGASKGVIFAMQLKKLGLKIDHVIDINPMKQDRYLPATGIKVESPENVINKIPHGENIYIMNSNYLEEIIKMTGNKFNYITIE